MTTTLTLCGYLVSAHLATGCRPTANPHAVSVVLEATAQPAMLLLDSREGALDAEVGALESAGGITATGEWADIAVVARVEMPEAVRRWVETLDAAVQYAAALRQDVAHLREAKADGNLLAMQTWGERRGDDHNRLAEVSLAWRRMTGRGVPALPPKEVQE